MENNKKTSFLFTKYGDLMAIACKSLYSGLRGKKSVFRHVLRCNVSLRNTMQKAYFSEGLLFRSSQLAKRLLNKNSCQCVNSNCVPVFTLRDFWYTNSRNSHSLVFYDIGVLKISGNVLEITFDEGLLLIRLQAVGCIFTEKDFITRVFLWIFRNFSD